MKTNKYNLGCGKDYREGFINVDFNPTVKADIHCDLLNIPVKDCSARYVLLKGVLEHIPADKLWKFLDEMYRICEPDATIEIVVPHYTAVAAHYPQHYTYWGVGAWFTMAKGCGKSDTGENYTNFRCEIKKVELRFWAKAAGGMVKRLKLYRFGANWFWNFGGLVWQQFWERFNVFGFDEIFYCLQVKK